MHPEIEGSVREYAREFMLGEIGERGKYCKAAEAGIISFDDIYFLGIIEGSERVSLDAVEEHDKFNKSLIKKINRRTLDFVAELYNCSLESLDERRRAIHKKVES